MTRILQVVDEALAASAHARDRSRAESSAVKEAAALPRTEVARGLQALGASLRADRDDVTYDDLGGRR